MPETEPLGGGERVGGHLAGPVGIAGSPAVAECGRPGELGGGHIGRRADPLSKNSHLATQGEMALFGL